MTRNLTHVQSPSYPGSYLPDTSTTCTYTFTKVNTRVCQVRLDFVEFVLGPPISTNVVSAAVLRAAAADPNTDLTHAEVLQLWHHDRLRDALPQRGQHHQGGDQVAAL